ncbi:MAG: Rrf2 family transcriptional regulator [Microthrixaceae bacterium]
MRLEITRRSDLATRALIELAHRGERTKAGDLAAAVGTTPGFLSQAMTPLVAKGWARSEPGPSGGYQLVADLSSISVLDVIEAIEGPSDGGRCVLQDRPCGESGTCALHFPWTRARTQLLEELSAASLDSLDTLANPVPGRTAL